MGKLTFQSLFSDRVKALWVLAHKIDKPVSEELSWTVGLCRGRADFADLQLHGAALAASLIIREPIVPKIIVGWDTHLYYNALQDRPKLKEYFYPNFLLSLFDFPERRRRGYNYDPAYYPRRSKYVSLFRSPLSVGAHPYALGLGYRAKYQGMEFVTTPHAVLSDIDTICTRACCQYIQSEVYKDPNTFVITSYFDNNFLSVGLCVYNMQKYRMLFKPYFAQVAWETFHQDSTFVQTVRREFPHLAESLDIRLFEKDYLNTERFAPSAKRGNFWNDDKTAHYHAWKGELRKDPQQFFDFYDKILTDLEQQANLQLTQQGKKSNA